MLLIPFTFHITNLPTRLNCGIIFLHCKMHVHKDLLLGITEQRQTTRKHPVGFTMYNTKGSHHYGEGRKQKQKILPGTPIPAPARTWLVLGTFRFCELYKTGGHEHSLSGK